MLSGKNALDPVCGMQIKVNGSTLKTTFDRELYYFCSLDCLKKFELEPQKYVQVEKRECCGHCGQSDEMDHHHEHHHHGHCSDNDENTHHHCGHHDHLEVKK